MEERQPSSDSKSKNFRKRQKPKGRFGGTSVNRAHGSNFVFQRTTNDNSVSYQHVTCLLDNIKRVNNVSVDIFRNQFEYF